MLACCICNTPSEIATDAAQQALRAATERGVDRAKGMAEGERVPFFACGLSSVMHPKVGCASPLCTSLCYIEFKPNRISRNAGLVVLGWCWAFFPSWSAMRMHMLVECCGLESCASHVSLTLAWVGVIDLVQSCFQARAVIGFHDSHPCIHVSRFGVAQPIKLGSREPDDVSTPPSPRQICACFPRRRGWRNHNQHGTVGKVFQRSQLLEVHLYRPLRIQAAGPLRQRLEGESLESRSVTTRTSI